MNIDWLQDFLALAEIRHFTKAASRRSISQAAFSRRIKSLEQWLGTQLIERGGSGVNLTSDGRLFEAEARQILQRIVSSRESLSGATARYRRSLTISMSQTIATSSFPSLWNQWSQGQSINVITKIGNVNDAIAEFLSGYSQILICHRSKQLSAMLDIKNAHSVVISKDRLVPVVGARSRLAKRLHRSRSWDAIPQIRYVPDRYFSRLVDSIVEQAPFQITGPHLVQTEMSDVVGNCVAAGMGIGWLPESSVLGRTDLEIIDEPALMLDLEIVGFIGKQETSQSAHDIWQAVCSS